MIRLSEYPAREKGTDDVDWSKLPYAKYDMNFRPLRDEKAELKRTKHFLTVASVCSAIALVTISVINALCPFLFDNTESLSCLAVLQLSRLFWETTIAAIKMAAESISRWFVCCWFQTLGFYFLANDVATSTGRCFCSQSFQRFFLQLTPLPVTTFIG